MNDRDEFIERKIIIGAITSADYLDKVSQIYKKGFLESVEAELVFNWCLEYFKQCGKAPVKDLDLIYETKSAQLQDEAQVDFIEGILDSLSNEYAKQEETDTDYLFLKTVEYFQLRSVKILSDNLSITYENYDAAEATQLIESYKKPEFSEINSDNILDLEFIKETLVEAEKPLFKFPGALGGMLNEHLVPGGFVGILAPEKRGKSWWLMEFAIRACRHSLPTIIFQAGDMSAKQMAMRMYIRLAKKSNKARFCKDVVLPVLDCVKNQENHCQKEERTCYIGLKKTLKKEPETKTRSRRSKSNYNEEGDKTPKDILFENPDYVPCSACYKANPTAFQGAVYWQLMEDTEPLTFEEIKAAGKKFLKRYGYFPKMFTYPANTLSVQDIRNTLELLNKAGEPSPKVIVIDYADIMKATNTRLEERHRQNSIWTDLRGLSLEYDCLVITATQADAASYDKDLLAASNYSEDKRKYGHVTAMFGLNQTNKEKEQGIMRINTLLARNDEYNSARTVTVLQSLQTGQPLISSFVTRYG